MDSHLELLEMKLLEGSLQDGEAALLLQALDADPELMPYFTDHIDIDSALRALGFSGGFSGVGGDVSLSASSEKCSRRLDFDSMVDMEKNAPALPVEKKAPASRGAKPYDGRKRLQYSLAGLTIVSICLVLGVLAAWFERPQAIPMTGTAKVIAAVEAEWEDEHFKVGREMDPGRMRLKSGWVKVEFADGAVVLLEGPSELLVREKNKAFCPSGKLSVTVPKRAVGFEIDTPFASVVDLGTAFAVTVTPGKAEVHVITGKVEIRKSQHEAMTLSKGRAVSLDVNGGKKDFQADPDIFCTEDQFRRRQSAYVAERQEIWDRQTERLNNDPSLVYRLRPEEERRLVRVDGSRWGRKALHFQSSKHLVDVSANQECSSLTLLAKVRIGNQPNSSNTLLIGNGFYTEKGEFLWQLDRAGALQFHLNTGGIGQVLRFDSEPAIAKKDRNTWFSLALVADMEAKTVRHYVEGALVEAVPWENPHALLLNGATIGNERPGVRKAGSRFWSGDVEEFWIFQRAFSGEEIREYDRDGL